MTLPSTTGAAGAAGSTGSTGAADPAAPTGPTAPAGATRDAGPGRPARGTGWSPRLERVALRGTGTALALAAAGTGTGTLTDRLGPVCLLPVAVGALWAAVPAPDGPTPTRWLARLSTGRTTLLAAGSVPLAALGEPSWWRALAVTVLLAGYLMLLDALGPRRPSVRPASAATALTASLLVLPPAFTPTSAGEWSRPLAVLGLAVAAVGVGLALDPRSRRTPHGPPADREPDGAGPAST
ncbi:hypothetical protein [Kitasatospora sp. NPDC017646]|uniref:hypothetical protein n=1 Tax=Kitasatospora sp. NPDC017646 TaxID=3364024 RepID=UPI0037A12F5A